MFVILPLLPAIKTMCHFSQPNLSPSVLTQPGAFDGYADMYERLNWQRQVPQARKQFHLIHRDGAKPEHIHRFEDDLRTPSPVTPLTTATNAGYKHYQPTPESIPSGKKFLSKVQSSP